ncbi:MAG: helix-turn-helix domain-containing protein [Acaryochloris sp. RU_4_1]|nr:helix-turn-helix domain-containing protein [Acaryochloris sp. RU_4_1]
MQALETDQAPKPGESIAEYVRRLRDGLGLTQKQVALKANLHVQSLGKLERGKTTKLNLKTINGLSYALQVPGEYLESVYKGSSVEVTNAVKFCPKCWVPGTPPDSLWTNVRAKFCFECGERLRNRCNSCNELITSLKHRFCPFCGQAYKLTKS